MNRKTSFFNGHGRGLSFFRFLWATLILVLFFPTTASASGLTVAVDTFLSQGSSIFLGTSISELLRTELIGNRDIAIVERGQLNAVAEQQRLSLAGVVETGTAVEVGKLVGARYFILGAVSKFGTLLVLTARLVDVETGNVMKSFEQISREGESGVTLATRNLAAEMLAFFSGDTPAEGAPMDDYRYYLYEALGYYNLGNYGRSIPYWEKMTKLSPKNEILRFILGGVYYQAERYNDALLSAQQSVTWDDTSAEAHLLVGKAYFMMGDYHKATPPLDRALELNPRLVEALFLKGQAYKNRNRLDEAVDLLVMAIQEDKSYVPAYLSLGQLLLEVGAVDDAAGVLIPAVKLEPGNPNIRLLLGTAQALRGNSKGAEEQLNALREMDPQMALKLEEIIESQ
ncbi:MAG: tetratricopeptide repeat protein [Thermovirgaceae bacterium]|nr:tetratricopeptide repeat protein [Thermovirgaceae bacterium]